MTSNTGVGRNDAIHQLSLLARCRLPILAVAYSKAAIEVLRSGFYPGRPLADTGDMRQTIKPRRSQPNTRLDRNTAANVSLALLVAGK